MPTHTMRAIRVHEHGGPEVLRADEIPIPDLKPGEVLVRVHAVGVNPPDWYLRDGMTIVPPEVRPKIGLPVIPGTDVSGVVEAVAADVDGFSAGDEVFGLSNAFKGKHSIINEHMSGRSCLFDSIKDIWFAIFIPVCASTQVDFPWILVSFESLGYT